MGKDEESNNFEATSLFKHFCWQLVATKEKMRGSFFFFLKKKEDFDFLHSFIVFLERTFIGIFKTKRKNVKVFFPSKFNCLFVFSCAEAKVKWPCLEKKMFFFQGVKKTIVSQKKKSKNDIF